MGAAAPWVKRWPRAAACRDLKEEVGPWARGCRSWQQDTGLPAPFRAMAGPQHEPVPKPSQVSWDAVETDCTFAARRLVPDSETPLGVSEHSFKHVTYLLSYYYVLGVF